MQRLALVIVLLAAVSSTSALYASNSNVIQLTSRNFDKEVMNSDYLWLVEYYAPWCGHCRNLAPEWERAATQLKGIVKIAAVNCDEDKQMAQRFGVQGFPTIKIFGSDKRKPTDYQYERTAKAIVKFAMSAQPSFVKTVSSKTFDKVKADELPKAILFSNKKTTTSLYKALSAEFNERMLLTQAHDKDTDLMKMFGATDVPSLYVFKEDPEKAEKYEGELNIKSMIGFLEKHANPPVKKAAKKPAKPKNVVRGNPADVHVLTSKNFDKMVLKDEAPWMVEFYAPWCGHCKSLKPEWEKAATSLKHIVKFGMVDATQETDLAQKYGVQGYPTIKSFPYGGKDKKAKPADYQQARSASALSDYAVGLLPSGLVTKVTSKTVDKFVAADGYKVLVFVSKAGVPPMVKAFAVDYKGKASFGVVGPSEKDILAKYEVTKAPAVVILSDGGKSFYNGSMKPGDLASFLKMSLHGAAQSPGTEDGGAAPAEDKAKPVPKAVEVPEITTEGQWSDLCVKKKGFCVVVFMDKQKDTAPTVAALNAVATKFRNDPLNFVWVERSIDVTFTSAFGVGENDVTVTVLNAKRKKYSTTTYTLDLEGLGTQLDEVLGGSHSWEKISEIPSLAA